MQLIKTQLSDAPLKVKLESLLTVCPSSEVRISRRAVPILHNGFALRRKNIFAVVLRRSDCGKQSLERFKLIECVSITSAAAAALADADKRFTTIYSVIIIDIVCAIAMLGVEEKEKGLAHHRVLHIYNVLLPSCVTYSVML